MVFQPGQHAAYSVPDVLSYSVYLSYPIFQNGCSCCSHFFFQDGYSCLCQIFYLSLYYYLSCYQILYSLYFFQPVFLLSLYFMPQPERWQPPPRLPQRVPRFSQGLVSAAASVSNSFAMSRSISRFT